MAYTEDTSVPAEIDKLADTEDLNAVGSTAFMSNAERALAGGFIPTFAKASEKGKLYLEEWHKIRSKVPALYYDGFSPLFFKEYAWSLYEAWINKPDFVKMDERGLYQTCRTVFTDQAIKDAIAAGTKQVVHLGSGLDTTAMRLYNHSVSTYEVDQTAVLTYKIKRLAEAGYPTYLAKLLYGDYFKIDLFSDLKNAGLDLAAPTLFIWMGNSPYIPVDMTKNLIIDLFKHIPKATFVYDGARAKVEASAEEDIERCFQVLNELLNDGDNLFHGRIDTDELAAVANAKIKQTVGIDAYASEVFGCDEIISQYLLGDEDRLHFWRSVAKTGTLNALVAGP